MIIFSNSAFGAAISAVTDYPAYVKDDTVLISGTYTPNGDTSLTVIITNPDGVPRIWQPSGNADGTFQTFYPLNENAWLVSGTYQMSVQHGGQERTITSFTYIADGSVKIPNAMKYVAQQWVLGKITDDDFIKNVQYYENIGQLKTPFTASSNKINQPIPQWVQSNVRSWIQGASDALLGKSLSYFYYAGYLPTQLNSDFQPLQQAGSIPQQSKQVKSNTNVILYVVDGKNEFTTGQTVQLKGQILEQSDKGSVGIPNASFSITDSDNGQILASGTADPFGTFQISWSAEQNAEKTSRNLIGVYSGNGQLQPSQSNVLPLKIYPISPASIQNKIITKNPTPIPSQSIIPSSPTIPKSTAPTNLGTVRIIGGDRDFSNISPNNKIVTMAPGSTLSGNVRLSTVNNIHASENIPFIMITSWGTHSSSWQSIQEKISVGANDYTENVSLQLPTSPGTYYLVFAFANEINGQYIAALSDSSLGSPNWNSGKTLADLSSIQIFQAQQNGHILFEKLTPQGLTPLDLPVDAIIVKVEPSVVPPVNTPQNSVVQPMQDQSSQFNPSSAISGVVVLFLIAIVGFYIYRRSKSPRSQRLTKPVPPRIQPNPGQYVQSPTSQYVQYNPLTTKISGAMPKGTQPIYQHSPTIQSSSVTPMSTNSWPMNSDYRISFMNLSKLGKDLELKRSSPVYRNGAPIFGTGNFGGVYRIKSGTNEYAVKYFTRFSNNREERYSKISKYLNSNLQNSNSDFLIKFQYLPNSIVVKGAVYPLLRMDWVDGYTLHNFIETNSKNKKLLVDLAEKFIDCVQTMQKNNMAHGDLSDGNVMIKNDSQIKIKLIDYDCMFIPSFSGQSSPEDGHANFQHPKRRTGNYYNNKLDNFAALVIYLTLYAISEDQQLMKYLDEGIFIKKDFEDPRNSPVIKQLNNSKSIKVKKLTSLLLEALNHDPLWDGIDPEKLKTIQ